MPKAKQFFRCSACGNTFDRWLGKCTQCSEWNTLEEITMESAASNTAAPRDTSPLPFDDIIGHSLLRLSTGISELDRVLGSGIVDGSLVLIGGDHGIGKSTLMLQMAHHLSSSQKVLYVSGEESAVQLKIRGERLGVKSRSLLIYPEIMMEKIIEQIKTVSPNIIVIDSIQSVFSSIIDAAPGSVAQIRHCAGMLMGIAKTTGIPVFLIGHVTKDGWIAGPKMLEHLVDTVLYFEGDSTGAYRVLRAVKNRFGPSGEIGIFEMKESGLTSITNPSGIFMGLGGRLPGSSVMPAIEGSRVFLVEIQSLVSKTTFSMPKRISIGIDPSRVSVLLAVLEKRSGMFLSGTDVVVNVTSGIKVIEPAADLAVVMAVASSSLDKPLPQGFICLGEIGLSGEIRPVGQVETRLKEAKRLGFTRALIPKANAESQLKSKGIDIISLSHLSEAISVIKKVSN
jgi:DNA repair protein RadA/Sms